MAWLLGVFFIATMAFSTLAVIIDPRGMFRMASIDGINAKKFSFFQREHFIKPYQILSFQPRTVLLGNSIANSAFDLQHPALVNSHAYSYGIAGAGTYTNWLTLLHTQDALPETVIYLLDFSAFFAANASQSKQVIEQSDLPHRLYYHADGSQNHGRWLQVIKDYALMLLSWDILHDCLETLQRQDEDGWHLQADGSWGGGSSQVGKPQRKRLLYVEKEIFFRPLLSHPSGLPFFEGKNGENTLAYFQSTIRLLQERNVRTILVIPPSHARIYETLFTQRRWNDYRIWKQQLVSINERIAQELGKPPLPLWDFSGYNAYTTETVPPPGDKLSRMQWFYDSVHFKPALGNKILDVIFGKSDKQHFGQPLTSNTVDAQLEQMSHDHLAYTNTHPDDSQDILDACISVAHNANQCTTSAPINKP